MVRHLLAWSEAVDNVVDYEIDRLVDDVVTMPSNERYTIPAGLNVLDWAFSLGVSAHRSRIFVPSAEKKRTSLYILPIEVGTLPDNSVPHISTLHRGFVFDSTEDIAFRVTYPDVASAERVVGLVQLSDGKEESIPRGERRLIRCTSTDSTTPYAWSTININPELALEVGSYALVGWIHYSANAIASRAVIQGSPYRGGLLSLNGPSENVALEFVANRNSYYTPYVYGVFDHKSIPSFQVLTSAANNNHVVYLDLVKIG